MSTYNTKTRLQRERNEKDSEALRADNDVEIASMGGQTLHMLCCIQPAPSRMPPEGALPPVMNRDTSAVPRCWFRFLVHRSSWRTRLFRLEMVGEQQNVGHVDNDYHRHDHHQRAETSGSCRFGPRCRRMWRTLLLYGSLLHRRLIDSLLLPDGLL